MRTFTTLAVATSFLVTAFARFQSCGSETNDFIFKAAEYSTPVKPDARFCLTIKGKGRAPFPANAVATLKFDDKEDSKFSQIFGPQLNPPRVETDIITKDTTSFEFCFYFPPKYANVQKAVIQVHVDIEHPQPDGGTKRVMCFNGPVNV